MRDIELLIDRLVSEGKVTWDDVNAQIDTLREARGEPPEVVELRKENALLSAQVQANADRADFQEEVISEIILTIFA